MLAAGAVGFLKETTGFLVPFVATVLVTPCFAFLATGFFTGLAFFCDEMISSKDLSRAALIGTGVWNEVLVGGTKEKRLAGGQKFGGQTCWPKGKVQEGQIAV